MVNFSFFKRVWLFNFFVPIWIFCFYGKIKLTYLLTYFLNTYEKLNIYFIFVV